MLDWRGGGGGGGGSESCGFCWRVNTRCAHPGLVDGGDRELVAHYWSQLSADVRAVYPLADMHRDYELCLLDLFRWMLTKAWVTITPDKVTEMATWYGRILPNRSMPNLVWIVTKVDAILRTNYVVSAPG